MNRILAILTVAVVLAVFPCSAGPGVGDKLSISVTNRFGDVFTNLTVVQIVGDGLVLEHKSGQMKVKYENLAQVVREKYQPLAEVIAKQEVEHGSADAAYEAGQKKLQADAAKEREQKEKRLANIKEDKSIEVPGQGWKIIVLNAELVEAGQQSSDDQFVYTANGKDGFHMAIFVSTPAGIGAEDEDVFRYYWPMMSQVPEVDQKSVKAARTPKFIKVFYVAAGVPNVNFYFAYRGKWVDVHIAKSPYSDADAKLFMDFDEHLAYY